MSDGASAAGGKGHVAAPSQEGRARTVSHNIYRYLHQSEQIYTVIRFVLGVVISGPLARRDEAAGGISASSGSRRRNKDARVRTEKIQPGEERNVLWV